MEHSQLCVAQLIALLQDMPAGALVHLEGCDCWGEAAGVKQLDDASVLLTRTDGEE